MMMKKFDKASQLLHCISDSGPGIVFQPVLCLVKEED